MEGIISFSGLILFIYFFEVKGGEPNPSVNFSSPPNCPVEPNISQHIKRDDLRVNKIHINISHRGFFVTSSQITTVSWLRVPKLDTNNETDKVDNDC